MVMPALPKGRSLSVEPHALTCTAGDQILISCQSGPAAGDLNLSATQDQLEVGGSFQKTPRPACTQTEGCTPGRQSSQGARV